MIDNRPPIDTGMLEIERIDRLSGLPVPLTDVGLTFIEIHGRCPKVLRQGFCDDGMVTVGGWVRHWHRVEAES